MPVKAIQYPYMRETPRHTAAKGEPYTGPVFGQAVYYTLLTTISVHFLLNFL
jgi:hypothetical protein